MAYGVAEVVAIIGVVLSIAGAAAEVGVAIDQDVRRRKRIKELEASIGFSEEERRQAREALFNPVQAQERESFRRLGEISTQTTGGELAEAQRASAERLRRGRSDASRSMATLEQNAREADKAELAALHGTADTAERRTAALAARGAAEGAEAVGEFTTDFTIQNQEGAGPGAGAQAEREKNAQSGAVVEETEEERLRRLHSSAELAALYGHGSSGGVR